MPPGVVELSKVPGLGLKKTQILTKELGITSIAELKAACESGVIRNVSGFGVKTEQKILESLQKVQRHETRLSIDDGHEVAERLIATLASAQFSKIEIAGAVRRWNETVESIEIVASAGDAERGELLEAFAGVPEAVKSETVSPDEVSIELAGGVRINLLACHANQWSAALLCKTGSPAHLRRLEELAASRDLELSPRGLVHKGTLVEVDSESALYARLGLPYIPPELREDEGEIEDAFAGDRFDDLIEVSDIKGMVHCHSTYSDGKNTVEEMVLEAQAMGMSYITITDHSPTASYAGGVEIERLKRQWDEIARVQEGVKIKILRGTESDILEHGALDYPDDILEKFDIVIASIHSRMKMDEDQMTRRLVNCMRKPQFKIWDMLLVAWS